MVIETAAEVAAVLVRTAFVAPKVDVNFSPEIIDICRTFAFFLAAIWVIWVVSQFALPKKRNNMMGGGMGAGRFIAAAAAIVLLLDITMLPTIINWLLQAVWWMADAVGII